MDCPIEADVIREDIYYLTSSKPPIRFPYVPPVMSNHGNKVVPPRQVHEMARGPRREERRERVPRLRRGDPRRRLSNGRSADRRQGASMRLWGNFEMGIDLRAKVTVFGDGPRGYLSKELIDGGDSSAVKPIRFSRQALGVPNAPGTEPGRVVHTMGYPLKRDVRVGGTWIYHMADNLISVGLVIPARRAGPVQRSAPSFPAIQGASVHPGDPEVMAGPSSTGVKDLVQAVISRCQSSVWMARFLWSVDM